MTSSERFIEVATKPLAEINAKLQLATAHELEKQIEELRNRKATMEATVYYTQLELIMVKLAKLYQPTTPSN